ncbi:MAG: hypothetical protein E6Q34_09890 [Burkholderiaceae bacterium]|nr:MAG: hypothetical protein E6Q34_09890 [Burkholderiaceae bacterium]
MRTTRLFILLALPSLIGSVLLMRMAGVGLALQVQQLVVAVMGIALALWSEQRVASQHAHHDANQDSNPSQSTRKALVALSLMALGLLACFAFSEAGNPSRWLKLKGLRLYFSATVLPVVIYLLARLHWRLRFSAMGNLALFSVFVLLLAAQPDLSQALAFTLAAIFIVWHRADSLLLKVGGSAVWAVLCYWCWQQADPLQPVPYVEGVIQLAASAGDFAMIAAIISVALLPLGLFFIGIKRSMPELIPIALYYIVILICAYRGLTPMPLLGFGAGPGLGYFVLLAVRRNA